MDFKTSQTLYSAARIGKYLQLICEYISFMGQQPDDVISWAEKPDKFLDAIDNMH